MYSAPDSKLVPCWDDHEAISVKVKHDDQAVIPDRYVDDNRPSSINRFNYAAVNAADKRLVKDCLAYPQQMASRQFDLK